MSSIFHRLDELERVQQEILVQLNGTEIPERDENARNATHPHEMHPKVTNNDTFDGAEQAQNGGPCTCGCTESDRSRTLVERVARVIRAHRVSQFYRDPEELARAAILEIADALDERYCGEFGTIGPSVWLRSQVEP